MFLVSVAPRPPRGEDAPRQTTGKAKKQVHNLASVTVTTLDWRDFSGTQTQLGPEDEVVGGGGHAGADGGGSEEETRGHLRPLLLQVTS